MIGRKQAKCNTDYYGHHATVQSLIKGVKKVITNSSRQFLFHSKFI